MTADVTCEWSLSVVVVCVNVARQSEVGDLGDEVARHEDVARRQVAVDALLRGQELHSLGHLDRCCKSCYIYARRTFKRFLLCSALFYMVKRYNQTVELG